MTTLRLATFSMCLSLATVSYAQDAHEPKHKVALNRVIECTKAGKGACEKLVSVNRKGCDDGVGWRCDVLAVMLRRGIGLQASNLDAVKTWHKGCNLGAPTACYALARFIAVSLSGPKSRTPTVLAKFAGFLERACKLKLAVGCLVLGRELTRGDRMPKDLGRAQSSLMRACVLGSNEGCGEYGESFATTPQVPNLDAGAFAILEQACQTGSDRACVYAAGALRLGTGVPRSLEKAAARYEKACDAGNVWGCTVFAELLADGKGVPPDPKRAAKLLLAACKSGSGAACSGVGDLHMWGRGVTKDVVRAMVFYDKGCQLGCAPCCDRLTRSPPAGAAALLKKACAAGDKAACAVAKRVR